MTQPTNSLTGSLLSPVIVGRDDLWYPVDWDRDAPATAFDIFTGQLSVRRSAFEHLGGFDESFTTGGGYGNEDLDFGVKLVEAFKVRHNADAVTRQLSRVQPRQFMRRARLLAGLPPSRRERRVHRRLGHARVALPRLPRVEPLRELRLDERGRQLTELGALLHYVGKIQVPNEIINKPGPLDDEEWAVMRTHTVLARGPSNTTSAAT